MPVADRGGERRGGPVVHGVWRCGAWRGRAGLAPGWPPAGRAVTPHPSPAAAEPAQCWPCCASRRAAEPWRHPFRPLRWTARAAPRVHVARVPAVFFRRRPCDDRDTPCAVGPSCEVTVSLVCRARGLCHRQCDEPLSNCRILDPLLPLMHFLLGPGKIPTARVDTLRLGIKVQRRSSER